MLTKTLTQFVWLLFDSEQIVHTEFRALFSQKTVSCSKKQIHESIESES